MKTVYLGTDHAGFKYKEAIKKMLVAEGYTVEDMGAHTYEELDDYPDFVFPAAQAVSQDPENRVAIVLGGSGEGEAMVANKLPGVRAAIGFSEFVVKASREHNNANVLSLGERTVSEADALKFVKLWLSTPFPGDERHVRRIEKIKVLEKKLYAKN
jgi:ribose 5-phosphate isomerase B